MVNDSGGKSPLKSLGSFAFSAILVLALSFFIAWPIWSLATKERGAFTVAVGAAAVLAVAFFVLRPIAVSAARRRAIRRRRGP